MDGYCVVLDGDSWIPLHYDGPLTADQIPLPDLNAVRTNPKLSGAFCPTRIVRSQCQAVSKPNKRLGIM
jgi:hypothetical protein